MGTYLHIQTKDVSDKAACRANKAWITFADEEISREFVMNYYEDKVGYSLHFFTQKDLTDGGQWLINEKRHDLGITDGMTIEDAVRIYVNCFPAWSTIGSCQIKLLGGHYCPHILAKVVAFLMVNQEYLEHNKGEYSGKFDRGGWQAHIMSYGVPVVASSYCSECKDIANKLGIKLPLENSNKDAYNDAHKKLREAGALANDWKDRSFYRQYFRHKP